MTTETKTPDVATKLETALANIGLEELAEPLRESIQSIAEQAADDATKPVRAHHQRMSDERADRESREALEALGKKYPDWKENEKAMVKLSRQLAPANGMSDAEYLENLYALATKDRTRAAAARSSEPTTPPKGAGLRAAFAAAKRGEVWK